MTTTVRSRLYLVLPCDSVVGAEALARALSAGDVACLLVTAGADGAVDHARMRGWLRIAQARDVAALVEGEPRLARELRTDGVHLPAGEDPEAGAEAIRLARSALGREASVGASIRAGTGLSRHAAMVLGEAGADYVAFEPSRVGAEEGLEEVGELVAWWAELFEVPCVAFGAREPHEAAALAAAGADFVAIEPGWEGDPAATVETFERAIAERGEAPS